MSPPRHSSSDETQPGFVLRRDGTGVKMDWRALVAILGFAIFIGGAWWTLQDHGKRIDSLATKVEGDHEILVEIRGVLRGRMREGRDQ